MTQLKCCDEKEVKRCDTVDDVFLVQISVNFFVTWLVCSKPSSNRQLPNDDKGREGLHFRASLGIASPCIPHRGMQATLDLVDKSIKLSWPWLLALLQFVESPPALALLNVSRFGLSLSLFFQLSRDPPRLDIKTSATPSASHVRHTTNSRSPHRAHMDHGPQGTQAPISRHQLHFV